MADKDKHESVPVPARTAVPTSPAVQLVEPPGHHLASINEPPGSDTAPEQPPEGGMPLPTPPTGENLPPLSLGGIEPTSYELGEEAMDGDVFLITATGTGFTPQTVLIFDDEELETTFVDPQHLTANAPVLDVPGEVDVEVQRGDDMSDIIAFEFVDAPTGETMRNTTTKKPPARKPAKAKDAPRKAGKKAKR